VSRRPTREPLEKGAAPAAAGVGVTLIPAAEIIAGAGPEAVEVSAAQSVALATREIEVAVTLAHRFPRDEERAWDRIKEALERFPFADDAVYAYKRGVDPDTGRPNIVSGLSIYFAREMRTYWGNVQSGHYPIYDDPNLMVVRCWAWDLEANVREVHDVIVRKRHQRKVGKTTEWVPIMDDRDLREWAFNQAARVERECLLHLLPDWLTREAQAMAEATVARKAKDDPAERQKMVEGFGRVGVTQDMLREHLRHDLKDCTTDEVVKLRAIWKALAAGDIKWSDVVGKPEAPPPPPPGKPPEPPPKPDAAGGAEGAPPPPPPDKPPAGADGLLAPARQAPAPPPEPPKPAGLAPADFATEQYQRLKFILRATRGFTAAKTEEHVRAYKGTVAELLEEAEKALAASGQ